MSSYIERLLRTNIVLFLLCVISIAMLISLVRQDEIGINRDQQKRSSHEFNIYSNMPKPSSFDTFTYHTNNKVSITSICRDVYYVIVIYPLTVDYREDLLSAKYNSAIKCNKGEKYDEYISLDNMGLVDGNEYYIIHATQADTGSWYDPY